MASKTNAVRFVEQAGIVCREAFYDYDENDLSGMHAAEAIGFPPEQVYKTLVARGQKRGILVFCIPVCFELDLKKAAKATGEKSIALLHVKELLPATGYIRGGCSPVGMKKLFPTVFHETVVLFDTICVSAGKIGAQVEVDPQALMELLGAEAADVVVD